LAGNRILVKDHTNPAANGIYVVTTVGTGATGVWDRARFLMMMQKLLQMRLLLLRKEQLVLILLGLLLQTMQ
jgi:hypothetical protein